MVGIRVYEQENLVIGQCDEKGEVLEDNPSMKSRDNGSTCDKTTFLSFGIINCQS